MNTNTTTEGLKTALAEAVAEAHVLACMLHAAGKTDGWYEETEHDYDTKWTKCRSENCATARALIGIHLRHDYVPHAH